MLRSLLGRVRRHPPGTGSNHPSGEQPEAGQGDGLASPPVSPDFSRPYTGPTSNKTADDTGFYLEVSPVPPYPAKLYCPGGVVKLLSDKEAYQMICERAFARMMRDQRIRF
jgi:hypothetical protein